jgi:hypothetical protein
MPVEARNAPEMWKRYAQFGKKWSSLETPKKWAR